MSTATDNLVDDFEIPAEEEVQQQSSGAGWRFSRGQIVRGPKDNIEVRDPQKIVGVIVRIGIHEGTTRDQYAKPYKQLEIEIKTRDGMTSCHAGLLDDNFNHKPGGVAVSMLKSFLLYAAHLENKVKAVGLSTDPDTIRAAAARTAVQISCSKGDDWVDNYGKTREGTTYVEFATITDKIANKLMWPKRDKNAPNRTYIEQWAELEPQLRTHPLFADRPQREPANDGANYQPTTLDDLCMIVARKRWATPEQAPDVWIALIAESLSMPAPKTLSDFSDEMIREVIKVVEPLAADPVPPKLAPATEKVRAAASAAKPFGA